MKIRGLGKITCIAVATMMVTSVMDARPVLANDKYPTHTQHPKKPGNNWVGPAIGLGITIIREVNKQQQLKKQQEKPQKPVAKKPTKKTPTKKVVKKPTKTEPKQTVARKTTPNINKTRLVLPATLPVAKAKPRIYSIDGKPWASDTEFVVVLRSGLTQSAVQAFLDQFGLEVVEQSRVALLDQIVLKVSYPSEMSPQQALLMASDERVFRAQPNYLYYPATDGKVEEANMFEGLQYAFDKMGFKQLGGTESGEGIKLAVIDSGISTEHPAFASSPVERFSAFPEAEQDDLNTDHGTAIASIIAAKAGMRGVAKNVTLMSAQVFRFNDAGHMVADSYDIVQGIDWAVENGAEILNLSFAGAKDKFLEDALSNARARGVIMVAAAGNEGADAPAAFPAAYDSVIAVTATDEDDGLYVFANRGEHVELAAPGVDVLVAAGADGYGLQTGTSMATAYITGSIALMLEKEPEMGPDEVKERLAQSAFDLGSAGRDPEFGFGRLDAYKAVTGNIQSAQAE